MCVPRGPIITTFSCRAVSSRRPGSRSCRQWRWEWFCTLTFRDHVHPEAAARRFDAFAAQAQPRPLRPALVQASGRHPVGAGRGVSTPGRHSFPRRHRRRRRPAAAALGEGLGRPGGLRQDRADPEHGGRPALSRQVRAPGRRAGFRAPDAPATPVTPGARPCPAGKRPPLDAPRVPADRAEGPATPPGPRHRIPERTSRPPRKPRQSLPGATRA